MFTGLDLGPRQRTTIGVALTLSAALLLVLVCGAIVWALAAFIGKFQNVLLPPVVAAILAMLFRPYYEWLLKLCRSSQVIALLLFFLSALVPLGILLWFAGGFAIGQVLDFLEALPGVIESMRGFFNRKWPDVMNFFDQYGLTTKFHALVKNPGELVSKALTVLGERASSYFFVMFQSAAGLFAWAVLPVYLAFFLMAEPFETRQIGEFLPFLKKETKEDVIYLFDQFIGILLTFFRAQIIIALSQGVLYAIGFALIGLPFGVLIGMTLGVLNVIPYLGSIAGLGVALPLSLFGSGGSVMRVILVLVVFGVVQAIEGNFLTPKIMGNRTGLHPALIIFAVFFWGIALGGILGMMLAIPLTAFAVVFWRLLKKKYIREVV
jgi:predicted PurR-regulated permease PerM